MSNVLDALEAMFKRLELSEDQKLLASKYYTISMQRELCDNDAAFSIHVWNRAQSDSHLAEALSFVDGLQPPALEGVSLISQDKDVRTYLSEHVVVLAEEKLNMRRGTHNNLSATRSDTAPYVTMICPDGSGIVNKRLNRGSYMRLDDDNSAEVCDRCQAKLSDHVRFIGADNIGGARDRPSDIKKGTWEDRETMPG